MKENSLIIPAEVVRRCLSIDNGTDALSLYMFYVYTRHTHVKNYLSNSFIVRGLGWSKEKVRLSENALDYLKVREL